MRFTDRKGIKIYCCVSFSPCKVWIKCHTLACELLNELVCSPRCGPCKYPSWVWNGDCLVCGRGFTRIGECRTYFSVAPAIRAAARDWSAKQLYWLAASGCCSTPEVADSGRWESSLMAMASGDLREGDDWQSPPKWDDWHTLSKWICSWADAGVSGKKYVCAHVDTGSLVKCRS